MALSPSISSATSPSPTGWGAGAPHRRRRQPAAPTSSSRPKVPFEACWETLSGTRSRWRSRTTRRSSAAQYSELMEGVAHPFVGMCLDTANSLGRPELLETTFGRLAEYTVMVHAKDYDIKRVDTRMGFSIVGRPAGAARVDFGLVLRLLRDAGREDINIIVEHWPPFEGTIEATVLLEEEWLGTSMRFLHRSCEIVLPRDSASALRT